MVFKPKLLDEFEKKVREAGKEGIVKGNIISQLQANGLSFAAIPDFITQANLVVISGKYIHNDFCPETSTQSSKEVQPTAIPDIKKGQPVYIRDLELITTEFSVVVRGNRLYIKIYGDIELFVNGKELETK